MLFHANHVTSSAVGDYHQVLFAHHDTDDGKGPYLLIQRQFEDWDDDVCYVETHDEKYRGHFRVRRLNFTPSRLLLELDRPDLNVIEVTFELTASEFDELALIIGLYNSAAEDP